MRAYWLKVLPNVSINVQRNIVKALMQSFYDENTCNHKYFSSIWGVGKGIVVCTAVKGMVFRQFSLG